MKAMQICEGVYWVGAIDWNLRNFHGYETEKGSTYNAYLIVDEKITLIDTVKEGFFGGDAGAHLLRHRPCEDRRDRLQPRRARPQRLPARRSCRWRKTPRCTRPSARA